MPAALPLRGQVWTVAGRDPRTVLVISGDMYNSLPDWPYVLGMEVITDPASAPATVAIGAGHFVIIDSIGRIPRSLFAQRIGEVGIQALTDVQNWLFRILLTN